MTFGLCNTAQTFQRFIHSGLRNLNFCFVYLDDLLVVFFSESEYLEHFKCIFQRLFEVSLVLNVEKCKFLQSQVRCLVHVITPKGIQSDPVKMQVNFSFTIPKTVSELKRFLGMFNVVSCSMSTTTEVANPLLPILCHLLHRSRSLPPLIFRQS